MGAANWLKLFGAKTRLRGCTRIWNVRKKSSRQADIGQVCNFFGRYLQDPLLEYITLGDDILSLTFHEHQKLISNDLLRKWLNLRLLILLMLLVSTLTNLCVIHACSQTLKYVGGLGPRKASGMLRNIAQNWGPC